MCILGWENLVAFDWNDLPVGRESDCKFLQKAKSPPQHIEISNILKFVYLVFIERDTTI